MPLSDEEQRLLEQMERALVEEDPKFASTLRGTRFARATRLQLVCASVAFVVGVAVMMSAVVISGLDRPVQAVLGVVGFVVMLGSATLGLSAWRGRQDTREQENRQDGAPPPDPTGGLSLIQGGGAARKPRRTAKKSPRAGRSSSGSFMQRMEDRWNKRRGQQGL